MSRGKKMFAASLMPRGASLPAGGPRCPGRDAVSTACRQMREMLSAFAVLVSIVLFACATATPPTPEQASSSGVAVYLNARAPISILPAKVDHVFFVRVDESEGDSLMQSDVLLSNYSDGGYFYLLNTPPGRYVAVAAVSGVTQYHPENAADVYVLGRPDGTNWTGRPVFSSVELSIYFSKDLVRRTEVVARRGSLAFMGEFVVHTSPGLSDEDEVQSHYFRLFHPGRSHSAFVQAALHDAVAYRGSLHEARQDEEARARFARKAGEQLGNSGWGEMLSGEETLR